jgi:hypothetical protein
MSDTRQLQPIGTLHCKQYDAEAQFFLEDPHPSGQRHLVVRYSKAAPEFSAAIPADWTEEDLHRLMLEPMNHAAPYPAWEVPARAYGRPMLFRWWAGEK